MGVFNSILTRWVGNKHKHEFVAGFPFGDDSNFESEGQFAARALHADLTDFWNNTVDQARETEEGCGVGWYESWTGGQYIVSCVMVDPGNVKQFKLRFEHKDQHSEPFGRVVGKQAVGAA